MTWNATFVHAQQLLVPKSNTAVTMEHVKQLVLRKHAQMQNADAIQDGLVLNAKYQVASKNIISLMIFKNTAAAPFFY